MKKEDAWMEKVGRKQKGWSETETNIMVQDENKMGGLRWK
jgi:hypothetical protein